jgi:hypothetical protein
VLPKGELMFRKTLLTPSSEYMRTIPMKTADIFEKLTPVYGTTKFHSQNYGNVKKNLCL